MRTPLFAMLLFFLVFSNSSYAQFRCGTHLVEIGDYKDQVLQKCGPPTAVERFRVRGISRYYDFGDNPHYNPGDQGIVEEWIYNFGDRELKQYLRFDNGVLQETRSLGYGN